MTGREALELARLLLDTLRLANGPAEDELRERWQGADHAALVALAKYEGAEAWLARRLKACGIALEPASAGALDAAATRTRARNMRADAALHAVLAAFRAAQVECVLIKSAALRRLVDRLPMADARASADVDLLVAEAEGDHALGVLRARGWQPVDLVAQGHEEVAPEPGERGTMRAVLGAQPAHHLSAVADASGVAIELHISTGPTVRPMEAWRRARTDSVGVLVEEQHAFAPTDSWLLVHAVTHALADADERAGAGFRLRYWLDGAVLVLGGEIRWELVRDRIESGEVGDPRLARGWLWAASRLAGQPIGMDELGTGDLTALQLERLLAWRLTVLSRYAGTDRWGRKLLEEGARAEVGLLPERPWKPLGPIAELRRRAATRAARLAWGWWRFRL